MYVNPDFEIGGFVIWIWIIHNIAGTYKMFRKYGTIMDWKKSENIEC